VKEIQLKSMINDCAHYTELRAQRNISTTIALLNGDLVKNEESISSGLSVRTNINGEWGLASTSLTSAVAMGELIKKAEKNAQFMAAKNSKSSAYTLPGEAFQFQKDYQSNNTEMGQKELIQFTQDLNAEIDKKYPGLKSQQIMIARHELEKNLITSIGSEAYHVLPRTAVYMIFSLEKEGEVVGHTKYLGGYGRPEDVLNRPEHFLEKMDQLYTELQHKSEGIHAQGGIKDVIIAPSVTGVLAHEAIGHPAEADLVKAGSVAGKYLNKKVGTDLVTMVDFAHTFNGEELPVPVYIDDEGTEAKDCMLIDKGVFKGYMNNKELADKYEMAPTGNARAFSYNDEPLVRMRNTLILPGESKLEEMISSIDDGYYFIERSNGQADLTSEFMFGVTMGYEIKKGKLGKAIKDTTISGVAFDMLNTVSMVSDEMYIGSIGFCGKKQPMIVSHGGPSLKCRVHVGGQA
jgi:TldD protein